MPLAKKPTRKSAMADRFKKRADESQRESKGRSYLAPTRKDSEFFKPVKGSPYEYRLSFVPYTVSDPSHPDKVPVGELWPRRPIWVHYNVGPEEKAILCPKLTPGPGRSKPCPICEYAAKLMLDREANKIELARIKAKHREVSQVIDLNEQEKGVRLFEFSYHLFGKALEEEISARDGVGGFSEPSGGQILVCRFKQESNGSNKYLEVSRIDFEEREDLDDETLAQAEDLDAILVMLPYQEIASIFHDVTEVAAPAEDDAPATEPEPEATPDPEPEPEAAPARKGPVVKPPVAKVKPKVQEPDPEPAAEMVECPNCKTNIEVRTTPCPKCKAELDWGDDAKEETPPPAPPKKGTKPAGKNSLNATEDEPGEQAASTPGECPHDLIFGKDWASDDEKCEKCDLWSDCAAAHAEMKKKEKKAPAKGKK